jgi:internalin A
MLDSTLASLPAEILVLVHSWLLQVDPTLCSCLSLEATCKHLRSVLLSDTRFEEVSVDARHLAATAGSDSFWSWIAAHGRRTDVLQLQHLELRDSTPQLCSHPGVLQARAVAVSAAVFDTLEPLRGLLNLAAAEYEDFDVGALGLEPLLDLPALEHLDLGTMTAWTTTLAPLCNVATLTSLNLDNYEAAQLDDLRSLSKLQKLALAGFHHVTSVAPLSCLTALTHLAIMQFPSLDSLVALHALSRLQYLALSIARSGPISLEPLRQLPSLTTVILNGDSDDNSMTGYDLRPLSGLSRTLEALCMNQCVLGHLPAIRSLGTTLRSLIIRDCEYPPGVQLASLLTPLSHLTFLGISDTTAADLDAVGQHLKWLQKLAVKHANTVTSLAALAPLTHLHTISLESCSHISSIDPLTALTGLQSLHLHACPNLTSLSALTALHSLRQLRLQGCPQLAASLPTSLQPLLSDAGQDE